MRTSLGLLLVIFSLTGACGRTTFEPVCPAPTHHTPQERYQRPTNAWDYSSQTQQVNCGARNTEFVIEQWRDFQPGDGGDRDRLNDAGRSRGFNTGLYNIGQMADLMIEQSLLDELPPGRQRLGWRDLVDTHDPRWRETPRWWQPYGLRLQVRVRIRHVSWNRLCREARTELWPVVENLHEGFGTRELVKLRVATACDDPELEVRYDNSEQSEPGEDDWRVHTSAVARAQSVDGGPLERFLLDRGVIRIQP